MFPTTPFGEAFQREYKARRPWPPDFSLLSKQDQFRLERRYRRRTALKYARPGFTKGVKIAQWTSISFIIVYGVLVADWPGDHIFMPVRNYLSRVKENFWSVPAAKA
ncbi:hypothetical protein BZA77DRAFT_314930 [Pyronema omphalodes]|nr:hypothetical protein BZA77DRAFT_314930 [Pyronema omphalodes]